MPGTADLHRVGSAARRTGTTGDSMKASPGHRRGRCDSLGPIPSVASLQGELVAGASRADKAAPWSQGRRVRTLVRVAFRHMPQFIGATDENSAVRHTERAIRISLAMSP